MAWTPPATSSASTPRSAAAAMRAGSTRPVASAGLATTTEATPATRAGTTVITRDDGYGAEPPGTYAPARATGSHRRSSSTPGTMVVRVVAGRWGAAKRVTLAIAVS